MAPIVVSGIVQEPFAAYREKSREHLTSHQLADFRKCPALYFKKKQGLIPDEDRPAYLLGRAAHTLILEGRKAFDSDYAVGGPINPKTGAPFGAATKAYGEWASAQGKPVLTDDQHALVVNLAGGVRAHPRCQELLSDGIAEGVVRMDYLGIACQIRMDWFNPFAGIVDLKTCDDLTWFEADAKRFGYAYQLAFYRAVLAKVLGRVPPVHLIAVEKKEPYRCGVWALSEQTLNYSQRENEAAMERLKQCAERNTWPTGYEECRVFDSI